MTTSLEKELQSELTPSTMHIEGITGVTTSNYVAAVTLSSALQENRDFVHVQCQVVEELPKTSSNHDLSKFYQLPSIKGKQLADPGFGKTTKIEILLGVGACNRASCIEHVKTEEPAIRLSKNIFGYIPTTTLLLELFSWSLLPNPRKQINSCNVCRSRRKLLSHLQSPSTWTNISICRRGDNKSHYPGNLQNTMSWVNRDLKPSNDSSKMRGHSPGKTN